MPISIEKNSILTVAELERWLRSAGDRQPSRTLRRLVEAGVNIRVGRLIVGSELLAALRESPAESRKSIQEALKEKSDDTPVL